MPYAYTQSVRHLGRGIGPLQGRYLHTDIHASSGIQTHDPSVREGEDGSCLRPRGHCDRRIIDIVSDKLIFLTSLTDVLTEVPIYLESKKAQSI
jgi:hypothetical protein